MAQDLYARIVLRNDVAANWKNSTINLHKGELAIDMDTGRYKVGTYDTATSSGGGAWSALEFPDEALVGAGAPPNYEGSKEYALGQFYIDSTTKKVYCLVHKGTSATPTVTWSEIATADSVSSISTVSQADSLYNAATSSYVSVGTSSGNIWLGSTISSAIDAAITDFNTSAVAGTYVATSQLGAATTSVSGGGVVTGVATLDAAGKVPSSQLPSYVDDVIEVQINAGKTPTDPDYFLDANNATVVITPESGKIYVEVGSNEQYRYAGTATGYVKIASGGIVIGTTTGTAFDGAIGTAVSSGLGVVSSLATSAKTDAVTAINEVVSNVANVTSQIGSDSIASSGTVSGATGIVNAINKLNAVTSVDKVGDLAVVTSAGMCASGTVNVVNALKELKDITSTHTIPLNRVTNAEGGISVRLVGGDASGTSAPVTP